MKRAYILAAALAAPAHAQAPPCEGSYEMIKGHATWDAPVPSSVVDDFNTGSGVIGSIPMQHLRPEGPHEVEVSQCGRQMVLSGGFDLVFHQSALDETEYVAEKPKLGLEVIVSVADHKDMIGKMVFSAPGGNTFRFPFTMEPRDISMPDMEGCEDDKVADAPEDDENRQPVDPALRSEAMDIVAEEIGLPRAEAPRYLSAARSVVRTDADSARPTEILPGEPGCPEELAGIRTCHAYPPEYSRIAEVNMLLDEEGRLLPIKRTATGRLRVDEPTAADFCALQRSLPRAAQHVRVRYFSQERDGMNNVQATLTDARTHKAKASHLAERRTDVSKDERKPYRQQRREATTEAYDNIGSPVTGRR